MVYVIGMPNDQLQQQASLALGKISAFLVAQLSLSQEFRCQMDAQWKIAIVFLMTQCVNLGFFVQKVQILEELEKWSIFIFDYF